MSAPSFPLGAMSKCSMRRGHPEGFRAGWPPRSVPPSSGGWALRGHRTPPGCTSGSHGPVASDIELLVLCPVLMTQPRPGPTACAFSSLPSAQAAPLPHAAHHRLSRSAGVSPGLRGSKTTVLMTVVSWGASSGLLGQDHGECLPMASSWPGWLCPGAQVVPTRSLRGPHGSQYPWF